MATKPNPLGRPRSFDMDRALDRALDVFWRKGYEGASLSELTSAMGINRPSLYAAFGDKETLFRRVLDRYFSGPAAFYQEALKAKTARAAVEQLLRATVESQTRPGQPRGCLAVQGALACGKESEPIRQELIRRRREGELLLRCRLERAQQDGELAKNVNVTNLARFYSTVQQGMAVQATGGASRRELQSLIESAMRAWPGSVRKPAKNQTGSRELTRH